MPSERFSVDLTDLQIVREKRYKLPTLNKSPGAAILVAVDLLYTPLAVTTLLYIHSNAVYDWIREIVKLIMACITGECRHRLIIYLFKIIPWTVEQYKCMIRVCKIC